jgi:hypothetical protein
MDTADTSRRPSIPVAFAPFAFAVDKRMTHLSDHQVNMAVSSFDSLVAISVSNN